MIEGDPSHSVVELPLTRARATELVREIAQDSRRWIVTVPYSERQDWRRIVNRRQIEFCLREGYVLEERVRVDEHGNWRFRIARICGGMNVVIEVALERSLPSPRLYVVAINGDQL